MDRQVRIWLLAAFSGCAFHANAQNPPRLTLFAGYSYMHGLPAGDTVPLNGWAAELTLNLTKRFGLAATFSGDYGSATAITGQVTVISTSPGSSVVTISNVTTGRTNVRTTNHSFLLGPQFRVLQIHRTAVNLTAGLGAAHSTLNSPVVFFGSFGQVNPELPARVGFAAGGGVSADIRLTEHIAYRAVQFRWITGDSAFGWQRSVQLATGLVVTLAK